MAIAPEVTPIHAHLDEAHHIKRYGYHVYRHGVMSDYNDLKQYFTQYLHHSLVAYLKQQRCDTSAHDLAQENFQLKYYHQYLQRYAVDHYAFIKSMTRYLPQSLCQHPYLKKLVNIASEALAAPLQIYNNTLEFRVVRPHCSDNNPLHCDHWFPYFTPLVNVYLPFAGSYYDSAMKVVPFSHHWSDDEIKPTFHYGEGQKTIKDGVPYSVPEIAYCVHEIVVHRPDVIEGDFMLFSPMLVHGGGDNKSLETRFSFEIRLEPSV